MSAAAQTDVIHRFLTCDGMELTGPEWASLHAAVAGLTVEVQQLAPHRGSAACAVEEAARKLRYAPTVPEPAYAAKLARCGQALLRHRARLAHAGGAPSSATS